MADKLMTVVDYCKSREISTKAFYEHKNFGRLSGCFRRKPGGKREYVIPAKTDKSLAENVRSNAGGAATKRKHRGGEVENLQDQADPGTEAEIKEYLDKTIGELSKLQIGELQTYNELEKLLMARMKRQKEEGDLIPAEPVQRAAFDAGKKIKEQCLAIADRCHSLVAAESDPFECKQILLKEINYILEGLSKSLEVKA